jgi:DNA polymerase III subunit epsilon
VRDDVVSFGVVPIRAGRVVLGDSTYREVSPRSKLSGSSVVIHGIRPMDVAVAPALAEVRDELSRALADRFPLAWSAGIEAAFLARIFGRRPGWWRRRMIDVLRLAVLVEGPVGPDGGRRDFSLTATANRLGVPIERPHHALDDALTTAQLFLVLMPSLERRGVRTPGRLLRASR